MKHRRILSGLAALMLAASLPMSALAREWDIGDGDITITAEDSGQMVKQGESNAERDDNPIITGSSNENTVKIEAKKDQTAKVTLEDVTINVSRKGEAAIATGGDGNVTIELNGGNVFQSGENHAGLEKGNKGSLKITDKDDNGALTTRGGQNGAGIGGGDDMSVSNITISGGHITVTGGDYGSGIGGGADGSGSNITISGGNVTAVGRDSGAGIGGGADGSGSNITISGGYVTANGGSQGAGIGGGANGSGSNITISGGYVTANGDSQGAGIGGGADGSGSNITISGGNVTANGDSQGAGIGGGAMAAGSNITISGGSVTATGGDWGAGIGGGVAADGNNITISGGNITAKGGTNGAGIGGGAMAAGSNITISGDAQVKVQGGAADAYDGAGAGIGDGGSRNGNAAPQDGTEVNPDTSKLTANGKIEYYDQDTNMWYGDAFKTIVGTYDPPQQPVELPTQPKQEAEAPAQIAAPLYRVTDGDGKDVKYEADWRDGVLTITAEADWAILTGRLSGIAALQAQGIEKIVFITNGVTSEFATADLLAAGAATDTYALTHQGETVAFTLGETDVSGILG